MSCRYGGMTQNGNIFFFFALPEKFSTQGINLLYPGKFERNFRHVIFKQILVIDGWGISCKITLIWMSLEFSDAQSTLVQEMAWCRQAASYYPSQCWPRFLSPSGVTRPQWVLNCWTPRGWWDRIFHWPTHRAGLLFCNFLTCWHPSHITISFLFNSTFYLCIIIVILTWCIWYINWSCWQSYIELSVLMFLWYRQKFFISLYGTRVPWVNMGRGQPGSVSKFPPFLWVKLWVWWVGRVYTEITRYFPASWINWVTLVTKIKLLFALRF